MVRCFYNMNIIANIIAVVNKIQYAGYSHYYRSNYDWNKDPEIKTHEGTNILLRARHAE